LFAAFAFPESAAAAGPHVGFTTPKALGKAVARNRIRRRLREAVRMELESLSPEWSIVFNPRRKAFDCPLPELRAEVKRLFLRLTAQAMTARTMTAPSMTARGEVSLSSSAPGSLPDTSA